MKRFFLLGVVALIVGFGSAAVHAQDRPQWPLRDLRPVEGNLNTRNSTAIAGRVFSSAITQCNSDGKTIFAGRPEYGRLEAWIGVRSSSTSQRHRFIVQGDGETLFTSPWMDENDAPIKINVPVKGYSGIALSVLGPDSGVQSACWAEAAFVKSTAIVPQLLSPQANARLSRNTQLVWEDVDGADGYLLELQAVALNSSRDAQSRNRFLSVQYPAGVTTHLFALDQMPRGKWRWRVHALSSTGFLGQMEEWRYFTAQ